MIFLGQKGGKNMLTPSNGFSGKVLADHHAQLDF